MSKLSVTNKTFNDEIDLIKWIQIIWDGKWKIASIVAISLLSVFGFNIVKPNKTFTATTEIKPITSFEFDKYRLFNSTGIFEITQDVLLDLYIEKIDEGSLLESSIYKFNLINKNNFDSEDEYKDAVEKFASKIEVIRPGQEQNEILSHHVLRADYNDKYKWKQLLSFVNSEANRKVKASIINRFRTIISLEEQKKDFAIKDINIEIENSKKDFDKKMAQVELQQQFELEDITTQIENVKKDYDRLTKNRLAFLAEQAAIAKKLNIKKNTIVSQNFDTKNTVVTNVKTDTPFYLRGYEAIDEEIKLIKSRKDKISFMKNLFKLEQQKRTLEQDRTLQRAEKNKVYVQSLIALQVKKRAVEQDETLGRAIGLFNKTPLNQTNFKAALIKVSTTDYDSNDKKNLYYAMAIIIGSIVGVMYVLIAFEL